MISNLPHKGQMIFYDDENMMCYSVNAYNVQDNTPMMDITCSHDFQRQYVKGMPDYEIDLEIGSKVDLDPTMMRRIAKYNSEKDIEILQKKKEKLQEEIEQLEENKEKQEKRLQSVKDFISEFFDTTHTTVDNFIESKYADYDDYDEDNEDYE